MGRYTHDTGPRGRGFRSKPERAEFVPWKPDVCEEPGCNARHPCLSHDGMKGPWRCPPCHAKAGPRPPDPPPSFDQDAPGRLL